MVIYDPNGPHGGSSDDDDDHHQKKGSTTTDATNSSKEVAKLVPSLAVRKSGSLSGGAGGVGRATPSPVVVGLLDISKGGSKVFLNRTEALLTQRFAKSSTSFSVKRFVKPTFNRPAPEALRREVLAAGCTHLIGALAD
jgi:hypothetical protein